MHSLSKREREQPEVYGTKCNSRFKESGCELRDDGRWPTSSSIHDLARLNVKVGKVRFCRWDDEDAGQHKICVINSARGDINDRFSLDDDLCFDQSEGAG